MTLKEIQEHIGKKVTLNGKGDLGMDFNLQILIFKKAVLTLKKVTKGGKVLVVDDGGKEFSVPPKNINKYGS